MIKVLALKPVELNTLPALPIVIVRSNIPGKVALNNQDISTSITFERFTYSNMFCFISYMFMS